MSYYYGGRQVQTAKRSMNAWMMQTPKQMQHKKAAQEK